MPFMVKIGHFLMYALHPIYLAYQLLETGQLFITVERTLVRECIDRHKAYLYHHEAQSERSWRAL